MACLGFFTVMSAHYDVHMCFEQAFLEFSYPYRLFYYFVAMSVRRFFYYNPFCLSTGSIVASGLGYNGVKDGEHQWNKVIGVYIWELETAGSPIEMLRYWNH